MRELVEGILFGMLVAFYDFTVDDVWEEFAKFGIDPDRVPAKAVKDALMDFRRLGLIRTTGEQRLSRRGDQHCRRVNVWRTKVMGKSRMSDADCLAMRDAAVLEWSEYMNSVAK